MRDAIKQIGYWFERFIDTDYLLTPLAVVRWNNFEKDQDLKIMVFGFRIFYWKIWG